MTVTERSKKDVAFCVRCFASEDSGSWCATGSQTWCANCSAGGTLILIPEYAIKSIREQASWVGRRYYPSEEDLHRQAELKRMREALPIPHNRTASYVAESDRWVVSQPLLTGQVRQVMVVSADEDDALQKTKAQLPWLAKD